MDTSLERVLVLAECALHDLEVREIKSIGGFLDGESGKLIVPSQFQERFAAVRCMRGVVSEARVYLDHCLEVNPELNCPITIS